MDGLMIKFVTLKSVSYTHLDVYKRQADHPCNCIRIDFDWTAFSVLVEQCTLNPAFEIFINAEAHCIHGYTTVSYTHLDVYKRQLYCFLTLFRRKLG